MEQSLVNKIKEGLSLEGLDPKSYSPLSLAYIGDAIYEIVIRTIVMSAGIGLAGVLSGFVKNSANFNSFLFGSIVSISTAELLGVCAVSAAVLLLLILFRKELFYIGFDENAARISGVPVRKVNFLFTVLTACTVSIASRTVGTLIISSMLVVPVAFGMQMGNSYRMTVLWSVLAAVGTTILGLFISYYWGTKPGGTIVLLEVACFVAALGIKGKEMGR